MSPARSPKEIGEILKDARLKKGLTIDRVQKTSHIQSGIIEALEEGKADTALSRVYVLLFLKKYASLLDLDGESLAANYKTFYSGEEEQILDVTGGAVDAPSQAKRWAVLALVLLGSVLLILLALYLGLKIRNLSSSARKSVPPRVVKKVEPPKPRKVIPLKKEVKTTSDRLFPIPSTSPIELTLLGTDDAWMKVVRDGSTIFEGTLKKGRKITWSAQNKIDLWVGRAEALDFTINGIPIGKIGKGNLKDVQLSRSGLKVGDGWLIHSAQ